LYIDNKGDTKLIDTVNLHAFDLYIQDPDSTDPDDKILLLEALPDST
jgi:hypothetical protein